jgi:hypothetical protein
MIKQTQKNDTEAIAVAIPMSPAGVLAERAGAFVLTAMAMLVSVEMIIHHNPWTGSNHNSGSSQSSSSELFARAEGKGEAARLPEEFDIGLQTPHITGI